MLVAGTALAIAIATGMVSTPATAPAPPAYSEQEVAHVAAKLAEAEFQQSATLCPERKYRKAQAKERAAFEQAHPEFLTALAVDVRPELDDVVARHLARTAALEQQMAQMFQMMPALRTEACEKPDNGSPDGFARHLANARRMLADAESTAPPPPVEPQTGLAPADVGPIVAAVLQHPDVAMYLHPDLPGRVPVRVALAAPHAAAPVALELYGAPVETTEAGDASAVQLALKPYADRVEVDVRYRPEGIFGTVRVESRDGAWVATQASILE